jgi:hypothetical protein
MTNHEIIRSVVVRRDFDFMDHWEYFQIVKCRGCDDISFRYNWVSTDDCIIEDQHTEFIDHVRLYPPRLAGRAPLDKAYQLPPRIYSIYSETHAALCSQQPVLAGIGMRAIVEAVCADQEAKEWNLKLKIESLVEKDVLTRRGAEILHGIRTMGNEAAHEMQPNTEEELRTALDVVEHLLNGVYLLRMTSGSEDF